MRTEPTEDLLTLREVAEIMRVSTTTVRQWITIGELPAVKLGGTVRIRRADLNAALKRPARPARWEAP